MLSKRIKQFPFRCGSTSCPKMLDDYSDYRFKRVRPPLKDTVKRKGCEQLSTSVWYLSNTILSDDEVSALPLIGIILPSPDPTGAQNIGGSYGVSKDILFEQLFKGNKQQPLKVALLYVTRGYSFNKVLKNELVSSKISPQAIAYCLPYLQRDLNLLKPSQLLLCGQEVVSLFVTAAPDLATFRRLDNQKIILEGHEYPVQGTFNPHLAAIAPVYIKNIQEDCRKLFEAPRDSFETSYKLITEIDEALDYITYLEEFEGLIAFDVETENLNRKAQNKLATLQFSTNARKGIVIPYHHKDTPFSPDDLTILTKRLTRLFKEPIKAKGWIAHNAKFENMLMEMHFGTMLESAPIYDTQAMAFLLDETRSERKADVPKDGGIYSLKQLAWDLLNFRGYDKGLLKIRKDGNLFDLPLEDLAQYGAMDTVVTYNLYHRIVELAKEDYNYDETLLKFTRLFYGPITKLLAHIERTGFKTDLKTLRKLSSRVGPFETIIKEAEEQLKRTEAFHEANKKLVASRGGGQVKGVMGDIPWVLDFSKPDHQALVFFKTMELEPVSFSEKTGRPAIDDEFFEAYCSDDKKGIEGYLEVDIFYKYQEAKKMRDTFISKMMERVDPETGDPDSKIDQRIRSDIHYSRLVTGRFAMTRPNMQQLPRCLSGDSLIATSGGLFSLLELIERKPRGLLIPTRRGEKPISRFLQKKWDKTLIIETTAGTRIQGSEEHPVLVYTKKCLLEWKTLKEINTEDYLVIKTNTLKVEEIPILPTFMRRKVVQGSNVYKPQRTPEKLTPEFSRCMGYLLSEGFISKMGIHFCNSNKAIFEDYVACMRASFPDAKVSARFTERDGCWYSDTCSVDIVDFFETFGFTKKTKSATKQIPLFIRTAPKILWLHFFNAFLAGDGNVQVSRNGVLVRVFSKSEKMMREMRSLLLGHGYYCTMRKNRIWYVNLAAKSSIRILEEMPLRHLLREAKGFSIKGEPTYFKIPYLKEHLRPLIKSVKLATGCYYNESGEVITTYLNLFDNPSPNFSRSQVKDKVEAIRSVFNSIGSCLQEIVEQDFVLEKIKTQEEKEGLILYDLTVDDEHSYIAEGAVVHNSEEGLSANEFGVRKAVKDVFTVDRNHALLQVDYKVNEVRWAAILAKDIEMARIFNEAAQRMYVACLEEDHIKIKEAEFAEDIHRNTAAAAFNVTLAEVSKSQRSASKAIVFGILFQQSAKALGENIGVSEEEAIEFQNKFFSKMVGVEKLIKDLKAHSSQFGFVETPHGRRRRFWAFQLPDSYPNKESQVARNLRQAVNAPIQGCASDASMLGGAYSLLEYIQKNNKKWLIQNVVHDSCLIQVPMEETSDAILIMQSLFVDGAKKKMEEMGVEFNLPLGIDVEAGKYWGSLEKWNGTKTQAYALQDKIIEMWKDN